MGQHLYSNARRLVLNQSTDTIKLDSLSIIEGSVITMTQSGVKLDSNLYKIDYSQSLWIWKHNAVHPDATTLLFRVYPYSFSQNNYHKDTHRIGKEDKGLYNPYAIGKDNRNAELFKFDGLNKNGSISRGISFGNKQDVIVNSSLNLQLSGKLGNGVEILAAITDENIPFQADGNTQQIQDFDKVFIQFSKNNSRLIVGDFELKRPNSYFMNFYKKAQGLSVSTAFNTDKSAKSGVMRVAASGAISKGKFARNTIATLEGNQGPYKLSGANNETFIIVLSGSEKMYLNGVLLQRGQQNDYIIDYNSAAITFTARHLITKDSRVVIEFQYSDKNYSRSLFYFNDEYDKDKLKLRFNFFSEQDAKNQPLLQTLSDAQKITLHDAGDDMSKAYSDNADSIAFAKNEVLYRKVDTIINTIHYNIYQYSVDPNLSHFRLTFSYLGANKGNYDVDNTTAANGRVYKWIAPINGVPQGSYEPKTLLIAPKKQQLLTFGGDYDISKNSKVTAELAYSNNDQNLFADKDKANDDGYAVKVGFLNTKDLDKKGEEGWKLKSGVNYEGVSKNFNPIERYRAVEFERDWNITDVKALGTEQIAGLSLDLTKKQLGNINYQFKTFTKESIYKGFLNSFNAQINWHKLRLVTYASLLNTEGNANKTRYIRQRSDLSKAWKNIITGFNEEQEINSFYSLPSDTLQSNSFMYYQWQAYVMNADTGKNKYRVDYTQRLDFAAKNNNFIPSTLAKSFGLTTELARKSNSRLTSLTTYRKLDILDATTTDKQSENSLLNRIDYALTLLKGGIVSNTFYEIGAGQELKKDYTFQNVGLGKGVFVWNDRNGDGLYQKNEFDEAKIPGTGEFVKIYIPTNEFIKTRSNEFNQSLTLAPAAYWQNVEKGTLKYFLNRFSNQASLQLTRKVLKDASKPEIYFLNPFAAGVLDSTLVTSQSLFRNTFYFNRSKSKFGADLNFQNQQNKTLLVSGFDTKTINESGVNVRLDLSHKFSYYTSFKNGIKTSNSELFPDRNYRLNYNEVEPKLNYQTNASFRISFAYKYSEKKNTTGVENVNIQRLTGELKFNTIKVGSLQAKIGLVLIKFNGDPNTTVSYEMLEGLKDGTNTNWGLSLQRSLSNNTQLSLNYEGRKSEGTNTVHLGGVQVRAFF
jgi:hypothetical protein